jgi:hypothetical protein
MPDMEIPNEAITFETPDDTKTVELEEDALLYDSEMGVWKIPEQKFESEGSIEYRVIPEHRVYEVKRTETSSQHGF